MGGSRKLKTEFWKCKKRGWLVVASLLVLSAPLTGGEEFSTVSSQQHAILEALTPEQLREFLAGASPANIVLRDGESLAKFLERNGSGFELSWSTLDGGGSTIGSFGGDFELAGTVGQPDAGPSAEADFELIGGFWVNLPNPEAAIFEDGFESGDTSAWSGTTGLQQ